MSAAELRWHQQDFVTQGLQRRGLELGRQAEPLEPVHQVVGQQQQVKVGLVGQVVASGDVTQGVVAFELLDDQFDSGPVVVEAPEVEWLQGQIGDENLVMIVPELKQSQLFAGIFRLRSSDHHETRRMCPAVGLIAKRGRLDAPAETAIAQAAQPTLNGRSQSSHDDVASPLLLHPVGELVIEKPFVGAQNHALALLRDFAEAGLHTLQRAAWRAHIPGPQLAMPEVAGPRFETQKRVVRAAAGLARVVPDAGTLLFAVEHQNRRVQIENQTRRCPRASQHAAQEPVVQLAQLRQGDRSYPQQKAAHRGGIGIGLQPSQKLEDTVLLQQLGRLDSFQTEHHRIQQGQEHLSHTVAVVSLEDSNFLSDGALEPGASEKAMQQVHATIMSKVAGTEADGKLARTLGHLRQKLPLG